MTSGRFVAVASRSAGSVMSGGHGLREDGLEVLRVLEVLCCIFPKFFQCLGELCSIATLLVAFEYMTIHVGIASFEIAHGGGMVDPTGSAVASVP
jgi:hypothetical protein